MLKTANRLNIIEADPEVGSALALFLAAAGYDVETDFNDGSAFILAESIEPDLRLDEDDLRGFANQLRERLDDSAEEVEFAELSSEFRHPAA